MHFKLAIPAVLALTTLSTAVPLPTLSNRHKPHKLKVKCNNEKSVPVIARANLAVSDMICCPQDHHKGDWKDDVGPLCVADHGETMEPGDVKECNVDGKKSKTKSAHGHQVCEALK